MNLRFNLETLAKDGDILGRYIMVFYNYLSGMLLGNFFR